MASLQKPLAMREPSSQLEDDADATQARPPRTGILSTGLSRAIVISTVLFVAAIVTPLLTMHRYAVTAGTRGDIQIGRAHV